MIVAEVFLLSSCLHFVALLAPSVVSKLPLLGRQIKDHPHTDVETVNNIDSSLYDR